jgi:type IV pilus assembly protein PilB
MLRKRLGDILTGHGLVSEVQLQAALERQRNTGKRLGRILVEEGMIQAGALASHLSEQLSLPLISSLQGISYVNGAMLPRSFIEERRVFPAAVDRNSITLAMVDPLDLVTVKDVQFLTGKTVRSAVTTGDLVDDYLKSSVDAGEGVREALRKMQPADRIEVIEGGEEEKEDITALQQVAEAAPIVTMVNSIIIEAIKVEASDIHLEPRDKELLVRYRIDGLLRDMTVLPANVQQPVISRIKIMSKMDIADRRKPQDGSARIRMGDREIDLRVSTLPTIYGEKIVIRVLDKGRTVLTLKDLGIMPEDLSVIRSFLSRPQGMILVTGPTGSGKSTTLYAAITQVRSPGTNIITVEDPVEYKIPGINQVQVNERAGVTFASGLRSILRQDPNIIMVGEIRDKETAEIAFHAALTGHLVLSTLHTNNAVAAVTRLVDIGIEPFLVASSVVGVIAQRLVRRNCPQCLQPHTPGDTVMADLKIPAEACTGRFQKGAGCEYCRTIGYRGRVGMYEVFRMNAEARDIILARGSERAILRAARATGMRTMEEDGLRKAMMGWTTPEEILRVIPPEEMEEEGVFRRVAARLDESAPSA